MADAITENAIRQALLEQRAKLEEDLSGVTIQQVRRDLEKHFNLPEFALDARKGIINTLFNDVVLGMPDLDGGRIARRRPMPVCTASVPLGRHSPTTRPQTLLPSLPHASHPRPKPKPFHAKPPGPPQHHVVQAIRQTGCKDSAQCMLDLDDLQQVSVTGMDEMHKLSVPVSEPPVSKGGHAALHGGHDEVHYVGCVPRLLRCFGPAY